MQTIVQCSWCHHHATLTDGARTQCRECGHHVNASRLECGCRLCVALRCGACATCCGPLDAQSVAARQADCRYCRPPCPDCGEAQDLDQAGPWCPLCMARQALAEGQLPRS